MKLLFCLTSVAVGSVLNAVADSTRHWPTWRGPLATGVAPHADPPTTWSETSNVKWKIAVPGRGTASPVVWENQIFILTAIPTGRKGEPNRQPTSSTTTTAASTKAVAESRPGATPQPDTRPNTSPNRTRRAGEGGGGAMVEQVTEEQRFSVISYDRATGKILWQHSPRTLVPHEGHHKDHGFASASPVTDGEVMIASFGSRGLFAYDLKGNLLWEKDLGQMTTRNTFGEGSSPALAGNTVVVVWDHDGEGDFIVALDKRSGKELWRQKRDEATNWSTPLILEHEGRKQVVVNGGVRVRAYDLSTGAAIWEAGGQTKNVVPAPVTGHNRVYVMSGWRGAALQAITLGRTGDLTGTDAIAWSHNKSTPYVPSPLLYGDWLYFYAHNNAQLTILNAKDGQEHLNAERLEGLFGVYASPVGAADRVYLVSRDGGTWVIKNGPGLEVLAKNKLNDGFDASPAAVGKELLLRGREFLYSLAEGSGSQLQ
ncbi:MAG: PQQ-binding-like beta-propeller repeat protein [Verrucomicrobiales bacterium]|nr:PQQ-binding-like beta-propeller repeat protein [Verrucomicrobiales bacterium]